MSGRGRGSGDVRNNMSNNIYTDLETLMSEVMDTRNYVLISKFIKLLEKYKSTGRDNTNSRGYKTSKTQHSAEYTGLQNPRVVQYVNVTKLVNKLGSVWTHKLDSEYLKEYGIELDMGKMSLPVFIRSTRGVHAVRSTKDDTKYFIVPNGPHIDEPELDVQDNVESDADGWDESETHTITYNPDDEEGKSGSVTNESPDPE
jgi:hypothetical protein